MYLEIASSHHSVQKRKLVSFSFKETEVDTSSFYKRYLNELRVTDFRNFFVSDDEINRGV